MISEQPHQHVVGQRPTIAIDHPPQYLRFAFRPVIIHRRGELALGAADFVRPMCAARDQRLYLVVDAVDLGAHRGEIGLRRERFRFAGGCRARGFFRDAVRRTGLAWHVDSPREHAA